MVKTIRVTESEDYKNKEYEYEVREVDAWAGEEEGTWEWNNSYLVGTMTTRYDDDIAEALYDYLKDKGIEFYDGKTKCESWDGDVYEIMDAETDEPLFAAIPRF